MVRKQIDIETEQDWLLKRRDRELGVTEFDLIRRGIDQVDRARAGLPLDRTAWEEELTLMREPAHIQEPGRARGGRATSFTGERLERFSR